MKFTQNLSGAAILRAREQTRNGRAALLEFVTSEETEFSYRRNFRVDP